MNRLTGYLRMGQSYKFSEGDIIEYKMKWNRWILNQVFSNMEMGDNRSVGLFVDQYGITEMGDNRSADACI